MLDKVTDKVSGKGPTLSRKRERMEARRSRRFQVRSSVFKQSLSEIFSFIIVNNLSQKSSVLY